MSGIIFILLSYLIGIFAWILFLLWKSFYFSILKAFLQKAFSILKAFWRTSVDVLLIPGLSYMTWISVSPCIPNWSSLYSRSHTLSPQAPTSEFWNFIRVCLMIGLIYSLCWYSVDLFSLQVHVLLLWRKYLSCLFNSTLSTAVSTVCSHLTLPFSPTW